MGTLKTSTNNTTKGRIFRRFGAPIAGIGVILSVVLAIALAAILDRNQVRQTTAAQAHTLSLALLEHADRTLAEADRSLINLALSLQRHGGFPATMEEMQRIISETSGGLPQARGTFLVDSEGLVRAALSDSPPGTFDSINDVALKAMTTPVNEMTLNGPERVHDAAPGRPESWVIYLTRPLRNSENTVIGQAVMAIDARYFNTIYNSLNLGENGLVAIIHTNGRILFRSPEAPGTMGLDVSGRPLFMKALASANSGSFEIATGSDKVHRIQGYAKSSIMPLVVLTGLATTDVYAGWRLRLAWLSLIGGSGAIIALLLVNALDRRTQVAELSEQRLLDAERNLSLAQSIAHVGSWHWNMARNTLWWSTEMRRIYGCEDHDHAPSYGQFLKAVHPDDRAQVATILARSLADGHPYSLDYRVLTSQGVERHVHHEGRCAMDSATGRVIRMDCIVQDVTESALLQAELAHSARLATLGEMATGMAHELSQPLNNIRMTVDAALHTSAATTSKDPLVSIAGQIDRMSRVIEHIRIFSRQDVETVRLFDAIEATRLAITLVEPQFINSGIALDLHIESPPASDEDTDVNAPLKPAMLRGRPAQFEQVLINLLTNARQSVADRMAKATNDSGILSASVSLRLVVSEGRVTLAVEDTGTGVPPGLFDRLFEPFFSTREIGSGVGLGLSVSYGIVTTMGGTLSARNRTGGGATFTISLPLQRATKSQTSARSDTQNRILLVSDQTGAWDSQRDHLRATGYDVVDVTGSGEAYRAYLREPADLLVTNLRLDGPEGEALVRRLRILDPALPIIIIQPDGNPVPVAECIDGRIHTLSSHSLMVDLPQSVNQLLRRSSL